MTAIEICGKGNNLVSTATTSEVACRGLKQMPKQMIRSSKMISNTEAFLSSI